MVIFRILFLLHFHQLVHEVFFRNGKTFKKPRRPYEKERLDAELKLVGEYGLRCKRELWRVQYALSRIRNASRNLLTLDEKDPRRIFEGEALLRRMNSVVFTLVFKSGMAKSIHHAPNQAETHQVGAF
ncbi:hypothetical protein MKW98_011484 [Papaver atlanticum]|uniref:Small ribosomal subunit protein uS4 N-terminal domain-containing protein n=1 Tax=Papaver atlanticum TaxID=357466 RepID=A0AAD4XHP5_9MAGN|nr:hypothetical protein MKW98_011484 [Papaver atlanticum]